MAVFDKNKGISVASGFKLQAKVPLDGRLVVDTIEDRNALIAENGAYEGMQVYVKSDKKTYTLTGATEQNWIANGSDIEDNLTNLEGRVDTVENTLNTKIANTEKGIAGGVATLDTTGKIPENQLNITAVSEEFINNLFSELII